jgi:type IV pilus assembly protein PilC
VSQFAYLCLGGDGRELRGQVQAPDENTARRQLRERGLKILSLSEGGGAIDLMALRQFWRGFQRMRGIGNNDKIMLYRQLQLMLKSGHTLIEALEACARLTAKLRLSDALERIAAAIQRGSSFSAACAGETEIFNRLALKLIEAGEASGELGAIFERLASLLERRAEVRRQIITVLTYPVIVLLAAVGVIIFMVTFTLPRFASFLAVRGKSIPWEAQAMLDTADWLTRWGWLIGLVAGFIVFGIPLLRRLPGPRMRIDRQTLKLPLLGKTLICAAMAQVTWTFGVLLKSRLTVLEALRICKDVVGNGAIAEAFRLATDQVLAGKTLTSALEHPSLPRLLQHMAAIGEKSGQVDAVMELLGTHYQKELEARVKLLAAMIEPALILCCLSIVGVVYYIFFKTMFTVSTGGG